MSKVVHLSDEAHAEAKRFCKMRGLKMSDWVASLIYAAVAREDDGSMPAVSVIKVEPATAAFVAGTAASGMGHDGAVARVGVQPQNAAPVGVGADRCSADPRRESGEVGVWTPGTSVSPAPATHLRDGTAGTGAVAGGAGATSAVAGVGGVPRGSGQTVVVESTTADNAGMAPVGRKKMLRSYDETPSEDIKAAYEGPPFWAPN